MATKRLTITLKDDVFYRLRDIKGSFNVSKVCQNALDRVVEIQEIKIKDLPEIEKLKERLRLERQVYSERYKKYGADDARKDIADLSYSQLIEIRQIAKLENSEIRFDDTSAKLSEIGYKKFSNIWMSARLNDDKYFCKDNYIAGWIRTIDMIFEEIMNEI